MKVLQFPLAKITIWFVAGMAFAFYAAPNAIPVFACLAIAFAGFGIAFYLSKRSLVQQIYFGTATYILAFSIGTATLLLHSGNLDSDNYIHHIRDNQRQTLEVVLRERPKSTIYRTRYVALVERIDGKSVTGKILVNLNSVDFKQNLPTGTPLKIAANIIRHQKPKNPSQFDYGKYLENKSILAQVYADANQVQIGSPPTKDAFYHADKIRNRILRNLEKSGLPQTELAVIAALVLGQQQDISPEIIRDYQFAGAVHILSVSGLHVGLILMFLNFLLDFLPNNKGKSFLKLAVIVLSLWGFAILAGLSPSVVRSVTMFSFVAVGQHLKRKTNVFHTLLVSMLLILVFEPSFLFDIGFQLSYLALFFILWLQPMLSAWWRPKYKIVNYFWQILTVSFAAQIGTLPLSIYYFHQFPGLFFVTNLVVIPLLSVVMFLGIAAMIPACFAIVPQLLIKSLEWTVNLLNQIIHRVASFEDFVIQDIALNRWMMLALYLLLISIIIWLHQPNFRKAVLLLASLSIFQAISIGTHRQEEKQQEWTVFNARKSSLIVEKKGRNIGVFESGKTNEKIIRAYATAHFTQFIQKKKLHQVDYFNGHKILIVDSLSLYPKGINPDVVLLRQSPKINLDRLLQTIHPKIIVADASNYRSYVKRWKASCHKYKIPFHATDEMGYFKL
ncbi:ComEC/Rec2 family competence protein [Flavobacterium sp.]|uniref:ComEC/Rec2 family competence protein n=1 Tax=Flavobacterium sp. TaxID=239 RepID=UPI0039E52D12